MSRKSVWAAASSPERRLLLALLASLALHGVFVLQRLRVSTGVARPPLLARLLTRSAPPAKALDAPRRVERSAALEPDRKGASPAKREAQGLASVSLPEHPEPPGGTAVQVQREALPDGRSLAASALASVGSVSRDMSRQEGRLNPLRGTSPKEEAVKVRSAIADALEKQFGHPVHFVEESVGKGSDGSMTYYVRTEKGMSCFKTLPDNVLLSAPGQGTKGAMMFPTPC